MPAVETPLDGCLFAVLHRHIRRGVSVFLAVVVLVLLLLLRPLYLS